MTTMVEDVRQSTRRVAERANDVRIDSSGLEAFADALADTSIEPPAPDPEIVHVGHGSGTLAYTLVRGAIHFGSGSMPWLQPLDGHGGHDAISRALTAHFESHGPPTPDDLTELTTERCAELFAQEIEQEARRKLMASFAHVLGAFGEHLQQRWEGSYVRFVEASEHSADRLVRQLAEMPSFDDTVLYRGEEVAFYQRAQRVAADLHVAFEGEEWGRFDDIDTLTLTADALVPHVLRCDDVLVYSDSLAKRIDRRELLDPASPEEIEIRACATRAVDRLADVLDERGVDVTPLTLGRYLRHRSREDRYRVRTSPHLTRTIYY
jgi:hypothetical protein